jgi:hypothetical protein
MEVIHIEGTKGCQHFPKSTLTAYYEGEVTYQVVKCQRKGCKKRLIRKGEWNELSQSQRERHNEDPRGLAARHLAHVFRGDEIGFTVYIVPVCQAHNIKQHGRFIIRTNANLVELPRCNCWISSGFKNFVKNLFS